MLPGMYTYYVYDEILDLYALMLVDQDANECPLVLDPEEFAALERWTGGGQWIRPAGGLEVAAIRAVLVELIRRDPFDD